MLVYFIKWLVVEELNVFTTTMTICDKIKLIKMNAFVNTVLKPVVCVIPCALKAI